MELGKCMWQGIVLRPEIWPQINVFKQLNRWAPRFKPQIPLRYSCIETDPSRVESCTSHRYCAYAVITRMLSSNVY
jgi:hypothetical protein